MSEVGADPEDLTARSQELVVVAQRLGSLRTGLTNSVVHAPWLGRDADRFRDSWRRTIAPALHGAEEFITDNAATLLGNARQQREASNAFATGVVKSVGGSSSDDGTRIVSERTEKLWVGGDGGGKSLGYIVGGAANVQVITVEYADGHVEVKLKFHGFVGAGVDVKGVGVMGGGADDTTLVYRFDNVKQAEAFKHSVEVATVPGSTVAHKAESAWGNLLHGDVGGAVHDVQSAAGTAAFGAAGGIAGLVGAQIAGVLDQNKSHYAYTENEVGVGGTAEGGAQGLLGADLSHFDSVKWQTNSDHAQLTQSVEFNEAAIAHGPFAANGFSESVHIKAEVVYDYAGVDVNNPGQAHLANVQVHVQVEGAGSIDLLRRMGASPADIATYQVMAKEHGARIDLTLTVPADRVMSSMQVLGPGHSMTPPSAEQVRQMMLGTHGDYQISSVDTSRESVAVAGHTDTTVTPLTQGWAHGSISGQDVVDFLSS